MKNKAESLQDLPYMSPLIKREDASKEKGFTENFSVESASSLVNIGTKKSYPPEAVQIVNFYRFEGMTDPGDNNILYEIETNDGTKGTLVTPYGPECPADVAEFVTSIERIAKRHPGDKHIVSPE